ncbi:MAG TPA: UdgX family uracil-DNA binding protein [Actinomycetota bacterium]|nr:UdgX family uracil-DNA binding protein [Actinomycetota bacterium]
MAAPTDPVPEQLPEELTIPNLREVAAGCKACPLWESGTQTVFGEGPPQARVVMVGEQPGDREDLEGRPFVGPAGRELDRALADAGVDRDLVYITNVVKHFKWKPRGKRRIHQKPNAAEIAACYPWLEAEVKAIQPEVLVCLGATAAQALLGRAFRITQQRGEFFDHPLGRLTATAHPSSILRAPDDESRRLERKRLVEDLRRVAALIG